MGRRVSISICLGLLLGCLLIPTVASAESLSSPAADSLSLAVDSTPTARASQAQAGIKIYSSGRVARRNPIIVYAVRLRNPSPGERIHLNGTVAPSYCVGSDIHGAMREVSPCRELEHDHIQNPLYPIRLEARIYRASSASDKGRPDDEPLASERITCTFDRHHCPLTLESEAVLGGAAKRFVNLELTAWTPTGDVQEPDRMDIDCFAVTERCEPVPTNTVDPKDPEARIHEHGQLGVVRLGANYPAPLGAAPVAATSSRIDNDEIEVNPATAHDADVLHSARLDGLSPGDLLEVDGSAEISGDGFDHYGASYWVLARSPSAARAPAATPDRYASPFNGVNCLGATGDLTSITDGYCSPFRPRPTLPLEQVGFVKVPRSAPSTMYLNYVILATDGSIPSSGIASAQVDSVSTDVACYPLPRAALEPPCSITTP